MFQTGDKVIFHGSKKVNIPTGTEGVVKAIEGSVPIVYFEGLWGCNASSLSYGSFLLNDRVKIIGPVSGTNNEFFGFEGTVIELSSKKVVRIHLEPRDLFVERSSLERIESEGSRWWV